MQQLDATWNQISILIQANPNDPMKQWIKPHNMKGDWVVEWDQPNRPWVDSPLVCSRLFLNKVLTMGTLLG